MNQEEFIEEVAGHVLAKLNGGACEVQPSTSQCANVLFSPVATQRFYRSGRTEIDVIANGQIPVAPGSSVTLEQKTHPGWNAGCYMLTYRLANAGLNHGDVKIEWFLDEEPLDRIAYGSEIYDNANGMIGDGKHPVPLHYGMQCCIGALNKLRVRISHTGNANQIEGIRLFVDHGIPACCSSCAVGRSCQSGCNKESQPKPRPQSASGWLTSGAQPQPVPLMGGNGGNQVINLQLPPGMKIVGT